jgi:hypothetical protein
MAATVAASRFLRFLEPEEENALLAAASPRSFERNEVVLDQDVPLRAILRTAQFASSGKAEKDRPLWRSLERVNSLVKCHSWTARPQAPG